MSSAHLPKKNLGQNFLVDGHIQQKIIQSCDLRPEDVVVEKDYGSLSCFVQYYADIKMLFKIKNTCFKPVPQVNSCFLCLTMRPHPQEDGNIEEFLFKLIQRAFQQGRKTIVNSLKGLVGREKVEGALKMLGINGNARPENLGLSNYIALCKALMI
jgi:16S rRNA (adenine1518-N6/adenine1519-N6)-dimethyltransferase